MAYKQSPIVRFVIYKLALVLLFTSYALPSYALATPQQKSDADLLKLSKTIQAEISTDTDQFGMIPTHEAIAQMKARIEKNPVDYLSMTILGQLQMRDAKENDDHTSYVKAENSFRNSIKIFEDSKAAQVHLIAALQAQHKFKEALDQSEQALKIVPGNLVALAAKGDALLELGNIDDADKIFQEVAEKIETPGVLARNARVAELQGKTEAAISLIKKAREQSISLAEKKTTSAWYDFRLGYLYLNKGDHDLAKKAFERAIENNPAGTRSLDGLAKVYVAESNFQKAVELFEKSLSMELAPPTIAEYGDLLQLMGKPNEAKTQWDLAEKLMAEEAKTTGVAHYRERALFLLKHDRELKLALALAQKDIVNRQDVYSFDTLAWAFYKNEEFEKAFTCSEKALASGVEDAGLFFRMGMVAAKSGNEKAAVERLEKSLSINPSFDSADANVARTTIEQLKNESGSTLTQK